MACGSGTDRGRSRLSRPRARRRADIAVQDRRRARGDRVRRATSPPRSARPSSGGGHASRNRSAACRSSDRTGDRLGRVPESRRRHGGPRSGRCRRHRRCADFPRISSPWTSRRRSIRRGLSRVLVRRLHAYRVRPSRRRDRARIHGNDTNANLSLARGHLCGRHRPRHSHRPAESPVPRHVRAIDQPPPSGPV